LWSLEPPFFVIALVCALALSACAQSAGDAEHAISNQASGRLTDPECANAGDGEFRCSAADSNGRRIKVEVVYPTSSEPEAEGKVILVWPCAPAQTSWKALHTDDALRCGTALWKYIRR
jgi:hypothetical protein